MLTESSLRNIPNVNDFIEQVLEGPKGEPVKQALIHRIIQSHIDWCICNNKYCGVVAPFGHGKTENITIARTLYSLGLDSNLRVKILCNSDENAKSRVASIKKYIEESKAYHRIFPHVVPQTKKLITGKAKKKLKGWRGKLQRDSITDFFAIDKWNEHRFNIERASKSKDCSVEAWSMLSSGMGGRFDLLIIDDPCDHKNTIALPAFKQKVKDMFRNTWLTRRDTSDSVVIYVATIWAEDDLTSEELRNTRYSFVKMAITDDLEKIKLEFTNIDETHPCWTGRDINYIPLWERKNKEFLVDELKAIGEEAFSRGYKNVPYTSENLEFKSFKQCVDNDLSVSDWIRYAKKKREEGFNVEFITGVDLSSAKRPGNVITTIGVIEGEYIMTVVDIRSGKWKSPQVAKEIEEVYKMWAPKAIFVENVALQEAILEWMELEMERGNQVPMPLEGFMTGRNKSDPIVGLPSLGVEFSNKMWRIPFKDQKDHDQLTCKCPWCVMWCEFMTYPYSSTTDHVMSTWFAREGARRYISMGNAILSAADFEEIKNSARTLVGSNNREFMKEFDDYLNPFSLKDEINQSSDEYEELGLRW